jgi:hypothetical protein
MKEPSKEEDKDEGCNECDEEFFQFIIFNLSGCRKPCGLDCKIPGRLST